MDEDRFDQLRERLKVEKVIHWWQWRGCSASEIAALEQRYSVRLPATYRLYLETMGHGAGRLFRHDHLAVALVHVLDMTDHVRARMAAHGAAHPLAPDTVIILGRLDAYFQFIRCDHNEDSPVWALDECDWQPHSQPIHASLLDWLEFWCGEVENAIREGYFDWLPGGTRP